MAIGRCCSSDPNPADIVGDLVNDVKAAIDTLEATNG